MLKYRCVQHLNVYMYKCTLYKCCTNIYMQVCMYVCMYGNTYVCMQVYQQKVCMYYTGTYVDRSYLQQEEPTSMYKYLHTYTVTSLYACMYNYRNIMYVCIHFIYLYLYVYTRYISMYVYTLYSFVCMYPDSHIISVYTRATHTHTHRNE